MNTRKTRQAGSKRKISNTENIPLFYSSLHVSVLYGQEKGYYYEWKTKDQNIKLLSFSGESGKTLLNKLWENTKDVPADKILIEDLFYLLGYIPTEYKRNVEELKKYKIWAKNIIDNEPTLTLSDYYPDTNQTFNRVSSTKNDIKVFISIFSHKFQNDSINDLITNCDGFYFPPINCGFFNKTNFMTLFGIFHEEIVFKPGFIKKKMEKIVNLSESENYKELSYRDSELEAFHTPGLEGDGFERNYDRTCKYIFWFQQLYYSIFTNYDKYTDNDIAAMYNTPVHVEEQIFFQKQKNAIKDIYNIMIRKRDDIQIIIYKLLEQVFLFKENNFKNFPAEDPFNSEELFLFTVFRDILTNGVDAFKNILHTVGLGEFVPFCSGGFMFDLYSFGTYRRLTKDIDVKIGQVPTGNNNPYHQEYLHTQLVVIIYIIENILKDCLNYIGNMRIRVFSSKLPDTYESKAYSRKKYVCNLGVVNTQERVAEKFIDIYLRDNMPSYREGFIFTDFNKFLQNTLVDFKNEFMKLLVKKRAIKDSGKKGTKESQIATINKELAEFNKIFKEFIQTKPEYMIAYNIFLNKTMLMNSRPYIGSDKLQIGNFSTIYISSARGNVHGLIDFTFDSQYALDCTFSQPSNTNLSTLISYNSILCVSYLDFIRETIKLYKICSDTYPISLYNKCSPDPNKETQKRTKYKQRHDLVFNLAKDLITSTGDISQYYNNEYASNLENTLLFLERYIKFKSSTDREFSVKLIKKCSEKNADKMIIGGRYRNKTIKRKKIIDS
jgi:hypothetical protein